MRDPVDRIRARITYLRMEEVLLQRQVKAAEHGLQRYRAMKESAEEMLDTTRVEIVNNESALEQASTVY